MSETQKDSQEGQQIFSRRSFIIGGLVTLGLLGNFLFRRGYLHIPNEWDFLTQPRKEIIRELNKMRESGYVALSYEPIGPLTKVEKWRSGLDDYEVGLIEREANKIRRGMEGKDIEVSVFSQLYAVPDSDKYAKPALDYCLAAYDYLKHYKGLESLVIPDVSWESVTEGKNYGSSWHRRAYAGFTGLNVVTVRAQDKQNTLKSHEETLPEPLKFPHSLVFRPNNYPSDWFILISSIDPRNLLLMPFSSLISIATATQENEVAKVYGPSIAHYVGMAVTNSATEVMARDLSHKLKITPADGLIESFIALTRYQNSLFGNARQYISTKGLEGMIKHYMEDPVGFTKALQEL